MFSALRSGSPFYILEKNGEPQLKTGSVVSVSQPAPKFANSFVPNQQFAETIVDVVVKIGEEEIKFEKLPSNLSIANFGQNGIVVSGSKEAMNSEVEGMLHNSSQILESIPYHEKVVASCDRMLRELNPQFAKEKEQEEKIASLEMKMGGMEGKLDQIANMLSMALNTKKDKKYENNCD